MRFRTKVTLALLLAGLSPLFILGYLGIERLRSTALEAAETSVLISGSAKADAVQSYFHEQISWMETLASSPLTPQAIEAFDTAGTVLAEAGTVVPDVNALRGFLSERQSRTSDTSDADTDRWLEETDAVGRVLQQLFILNNSHPEGQKQNAMTMAGGGRYSMAHRLYHPFYLEVLERFGFYDIFLIAPNEARIVYSVMKEPDFATSLENGPYRNSNFGKRVKEMIESRGASGPKFADFENYEPSFNAPAAFVLIPVGSDEQFRGVIAFQMPLEYVQSVVRKNFGTNTLNMRSYVIGDDFGLRTIPSGSENLSVGDKIESALMDRIASSSEAVHTSTNELGIGVIAAVEAIELPGTKWHVISEADRALATASAEAIEQSAIYAFAGLALVITVAGVVIAQILLRPIVVLGRTLKADADQARQSLKDATSVAGGAVQSVAAIAEETSSQAEIVRDNSSQAASNVQEMSTAVEQLTSSISDVAKGVHETSNLMLDASSKAVEAEKSLADLERVAGRIGGMVDLINDVANRTNLLALNAAVEASHAGDAGRGFAVVAAEIRKLAGRTTESTEIIGSEVRQVLDAVNANGASIRDISSAVAKVTAMSKSLSQASIQQETVTSEMARRMSETASRVAEVDQNIETVKSATGNSAQAATDLVAQLERVEAAGADISEAVGRMAQRFLKI